MNYIHCITRKQTPTEADPISVKKQKEIIIDYLTNTMGFKLEKDSKGSPRITNSDEYRVSWKTDYRGSGNSKFGESITGIELFKRRTTQEFERAKRCETGDMIIISKYPIMFGDHPRHILEIIGNMIGYYRGRFIICDMGEITEKNKVGDILFNILNTMSNIRTEKTREMNIKSKRDGKKKGIFLGGHKTPFGTNWKSYADGSLYKLTPQDRKILSQGKPGFGHYINANGELVPNKTEQEAIKEMKKLRSKGLSYMKISKKIEGMFGTNKDTKEPNVKISHTGVYRIINPHNKPTKRIDSFGNFKENRKRIETIPV